MARNIIKQKCKWIEYNIHSPKSLNERFKKNKKLITELSNFSDENITFKNEYYKCIISILILWATDWFNYFYNKIFYTYWIGKVDDNNRKIIQYHIQPRFLTYKIKRDAVAPKDGFYGYWDMGNWIEKDLSQFKIKYVPGKWIVLKREEFSYMKYIKS